MSFYHLLLLVAMVTGSRAQEVCSTSVCPSENVALLPAGKTGANNHYYIGGLFGVRNQGADPYTCGTIRPRGLVNSEAFFWAIKRYQVQAGLSTAPDPIGVGGFVMDSCSRSEKVVENIYSFETCRTKYGDVSPRNTLAYVGPDRSSDALDSVDLMKDMQRTHVINAATSPALSNAYNNYTLRIVPSDAVEMNVMANLLKYKSIKYIQVIYLDDSYGQGLFMALKEALANTDVCITNMTAVTSTDMAKAVTMLIDNKVTKYVALLTDNMGARRLLQAVDADQRIRNQFVFLGTSSWGNDMSVISNLGSAENAITVSLNTGSYYNSADVDSFWNDFFQMKPNTGINAGLPNVNSHNPWFTKFWEEKFGCTLGISGSPNSCDVDNQNVQDTGINRFDTYVPYTLMAVDAVIRGIKDSSQKYCSAKHLCSQLLNRADGRGLHLYEGIFGASNNNGRFFNDNREVNMDFQRYKVYQVQNDQYTNVLDYNPSIVNTNTMGFETSGKPAMVMLTSGCSNNPCLECNEIPVTLPPTTQKPTTTQSSGGGPTLSPKAMLAMIVAEYFNEDQEFTGVWRNQTRDSEDSKTRFEIGHDWIIALGVVAGLGILCTIIFEIYILYKLAGTKMGRQWRTMWLGQLLLFGLFLSYLTLFAFLFTPTKATCGITRFGVGFSYSVCFAVLLVKLMVLLTSKTSSDALLPGDVDSPNYLRGIYQFLMFLFVVGVQVVIAIQWLIMVPPDAVQVTSNNGDLVWVCNHYTWSLNMGWENYADFVRTDFENHLISLSYIMFLILLTAVVAMRAHGIITNHRESVFIGIAAGFTIPVWIAWGLVGGLNKDHAQAQEFGDACIAFGLAITATLILFAMFLPKVRQLVNMGVEGIYLEDDRDTYYAGSVIMAPPSYKSRPNSVMYAVNNGYSEPTIIGDPTALHVKHPGSTYSAPTYVKRAPESLGQSSGRILRMTGDLTGKHPRDSKRSTSEVNYAGSGYGGTYRKSRSESGGGTLRKSISATNLGAL